MNKDLRRCKVTISGESYFLVSDESEEHVQAVARLVDAQMQAMAQRGLSDDPKRLAVLVAVQCASKMIASDNLLEKYQSHNEKLIQFISDEVAI